MAVRYISSAANQEVKRLQALQKKAKRRREEHSFIAEGERLFRDTPPGYIREIYVTEKFLGDHGDLLEEKLSEIKECAGSPDYTVLTPELFGRISDTQTPQGVMCVAQMPRYTIRDLMGREAEPFLLLLENLQDPGNLGTIFRTAEAAGVTGIIMSADTADLFNPKTVRATMSAIYRMPFLYVQDFVSRIGALGKEGVDVYAAHLEADRPYDAFSYTGACAFLIGNEGNGLTKEAAAAASHKLLIPMQGRIESLNAAMAAGILMYEAARQRRTQE